MNITLDSGSLLQLADLWRQAPEITRQELLRATTESDLLMQGELMQALPRGVGGRHGAGLVGTLFTEEHVLADNVIGLVASKEPYAEYLETGTKPHMPPLQPIVDWVQAVIGAKGEKAQEIAQAIRWKQYNQGTKAKPVWQATYKRVLQQVQANFDAAYARITSRLAGGEA